MCTHTHLPPLKMNKGEYLIGRLTNEHSLKNGPFHHHGGISEEDVHAGMCPCMKNTLIMLSNGAAEINWTLTKARAISKFVWDLLFLYFMALSTVFTAALHKHAIFYPWRFNRISDTFY